MRIVIDLQGAQAASRERGIGRYSLQFAQALTCRANGHEIFIALNAAFADTIEPIRAAFSDLLPQDRIVVWDSPRPFAWLDEANDARRKASECIREAFLASLEPDWIVVTSLFEGLTDDVATSVSRHAPLRTAIVLYDLTPLIYADRYLKDNPIVEGWYVEKLDHLKRANLLLSISESAGREAIELLGFESSAVVAIGTDCAARFQPIVLSDARKAQLRASYDIHRSFVMYTGGIDYRKNIEGLINAYATLPAAIRSTHQLAVVCAVQPPDRKRLLCLANEVGLSEKDVIFTGFVSDDDLLALYNDCKLFVFPSWHEGFGLPALEAMRCGKAVLAANTSSLPEVVGRKDALFDPFDEGAMAALIERALSDDGFRQDLERHGLLQSRRFNWDETAQRALAALDEHARPVCPLPRFESGRPRLKLAYVSPLPPEKSGIADYSADLLPELSRLYDVEVIVITPESIDPNLRTNYVIRSVDEFRARFAIYDRVLYHFGNSHFHEHMFALVEEFPGAVVLHDFYLSHIQAHRDAHGRAPHAWAQALMESHGYRALSERYLVPDSADVIWRYPANLPVLQSALGVIVHSEFSKTLARQWSVASAIGDWVVIPLLRATAAEDSREASRRSLGLHVNDLLICSFGLLGPHKLNHRLLDAWLASPLAVDPNAHLVFVGENHGGDYGEELSRRIRDSGLSERVHITGWAEAATFRQYLAAADIGVQLRTLSRGETSAAVLDCMNHGVATIVNANGSMGDLDPTGVLRLPDEFADDALIQALTMLARDANRRRSLGERAQEIVRSYHAPRRCAEQYFEAIEGFYKHAELGLPGLLNRLAKLAIPEKEWPQLAASLARDFPTSMRHRQLLVDVSELVERDAKSGIQRVVRAILHEWLCNPPEGFQVEPVYATVEKPGYRYARRWTSRFLNIPQEWAEDAPVEAWHGDFFIGLDLQPHVAPAQRGFLQHWRNRGVQVWFVVYDLLPVLLPELFPVGAQAVHQRWLESASFFDGVACISRAVADEMHEWMQSVAPKPARKLTISSFHLGADVAQSMPTTGVPDDDAVVVEQLRRRSSFLMVGTVEPRKGHAQTLDAFEQLWAKGVDVNLVIVGKQGWMVDALVQRIRDHVELNKRVFWLEGISDEFLEMIYAASTCLIAASCGEGFGLPLIEAAQHKLAIIARDIPVFREVADVHAWYFVGNSPGDLAQSIQTWLELHASGQHPKSDDMPWLTWKLSADQLLNAINLKSTHN